MEEYRLIRRNSDGSKAVIVDYELDYTNQKYLEEIMQKFLDSNNKEKERIYKNATKQ